jgi:pimeloyl-ACP methyl ester carboxylesterase
VEVRTLVMYGDASFPFMSETARTLARAIPHAELRAMTGQDHNVSPGVLAPVLTEFFTSQGTTASGPGADSRPARPGDVRRGRP